MILIGDSGSTTARWVILDNGDALKQNLTTVGFNPYIYNKEGLSDLLRQELSGYDNAILSVRFYGAGCTPAKCEVVKEVLQQFFSIDDVEVYSDLMAVVHSLGQDKECVVAILGTGSNSCYYDGKEVKEHISPLGFILGDEGSGAVLGRKLLGDILKNQLPKEIIFDFYETYNLDQYQIIESVYRGAAPNRFMASFTPFLKKHIHNDRMRVLVENSFADFIERNLLQYSKIKTLPVHFTGGIAYHFREQLQSTFKRYGLLLGEITSEPIEGLIDYYRNKPRI